MSDNRTFTYIDLYSDLLDMSIQDRCTHDYEEYSFKMKIENGMSTTISLMECNICGKKIERFKDIKRIYKPVRFV